MYQTTVQGSLHRFSNEAGGDRLQERFGRVLRLDECWLKLGQHVSQDKWTHQHITPTNKHNALPPENTSTEA